MIDFQNWRPGNFAKHIIINIGLMVVVGLVVIWLLLTWLDVWTDHGNYQIVPEVKGLSYADARHQLDASGFSCELTDSIYDTKMRPGMVVEQNPKTGTKVKDGRVVYLTITAFEPKTVTLPNITDVSARQARSVLEGLGIKNVTEVEVASEFRGLVLGVKLNGRPVSAGARVPITAAITLEVGAGYGDSNDSLEVDAENVGATDSFFD